MSKKYILIQNLGEIETNSFELIGASTKRDEKGKIGFFGSGLKYSIAYMMRKGIEFKIFSGLNEIRFSTMGETLKDKSFERICINNKPTSYTTTMGPTWTEDWFVLREIYCNALDEGTCQLVKETENVSPSEGKTRIYIEQTVSLKSVSENWNAYFADEREPLFVSAPVYTCYLASNFDKVTNQKVTVYHKTNGVMYRKGVRVHFNDSYMYDYEYEFLDINEDRTAKHPDGNSYGVVNMFAQLTNEPYIKSILRTAQNEVPCKEFYQIASGETNGEWSAEWVRFSKENLLVVKDISARFAEQINRSTKEVFFLPSMFARKLKKMQPDAIVLGMSNVIGQVSMDEVEMTPKMEFLLKEVLKSLAEMKMEILFPITAVEFENENILGQADIKLKKIYISKKTFDLGRREIALTLMEENEHILSQKEDETRAFQTHIFSQWLKSMEDANGLFL